jgi:hypothetical protein
MQTKEIMRQDMLLFISYGVPHATDSFSINCIIPPYMCS